MNIYSSSDDIRHLELRSDDILPGRIDVAPFAFAVAHRKLPPRMHDCESFFKMVRFYERRWDKHAARHVDVTGQAILADEEQRLCWHIHIVAPLPAAYSRPSVQS